MKSFWISCGVLAALLAALLINGQRLTQFVLPIEQKLEDAASFAHAEEWDSAISLAVQAKDQWNQRKDYLHITLRHSDVNEISCLLEEVIAYLKAKEIREYAASHALLLYQLTVLCETEVLSLRNIL